jgi:predicted transcriptional regulator
VRQSVPFKLFMNCFLRRPEKLWSIEELGTVLHTSRPTVYRHLNKLKSFDLLEEQSVSTYGCGRCGAYESGVEAEALEHLEGCKAKGSGALETQTRKGYRIRYGNLSKGWNFSEAHVKVAMEAYRKTVDHLQELVAKEIAAKKRAEEPAPEVPLAKVKR